MMAIHFLQFSNFQPGVEGKSACDGDILDGTHLGAKNTKCSKCRTIGQLLNTVGNLQASLDMFLVL